MTGSPNDTFAASVVDQILRTTGFEVQQPLYPARGNRPRIVAIGERTHRLGVCDQWRGFVELELRGVEMMQGGEYLDA